MRLYFYIVMLVDREIVKRMVIRNEWWMGCILIGFFIYIFFIVKGDVNIRILVIWVVGEFVEVLVEFVNFCVFEVIVESIFLFVEYD